ncbi:MAG TPA: glycosyltransferase family 2 protein [Chitinophagaceae bacterium]|nr:glycosyltransferase family 2 protein [Chitinophagaceae bacterium]
MIKEPKIVVIIPAYNEENSIAKVVNDIPAGLVNEVIVVNNNSNDATDINAQNAGATVLHEDRPGYGYACLKGIEYANQLQPLPDIVVFIDADYSDHPEEMTIILHPILNDGMDMVIGSRALGKREKGSMTIPQVFGNWLATRLLKFIYGVRYTDLGPFRAIRYNKLIEINMQDKTYGWTVEMQLKAAKLKMKIIEVPVSYRKRIGISKISGTVKGTVLAGYKIITTIFKYR